MLQRIHFETREEWLNGRITYPGIGASEAAAAIGYSPWLSPNELWQIKTGKKKPRDLTHNENVAFGQQAEEALRSLFMAAHPELALEYFPYDFLLLDERPWLRATLDGELTAVDSQRKGILEIKTALCSSKEDWAAWTGRVPDHYYVQILHQYLATHYDFVYLFACLQGLNGNFSVRTYYYETAEAGFREDADWLLSGETKFWTNVQTGKIPPAVLRF